MASELIYSATKALSSSPIGVASIVGIDKRTNADGVFEIVFHLSSGLKRIWTYGAELDRNDSYNHIITQYGFNSD